MLQLSMSSLPAPETLLDGRYRLKLVLGEGNMGTVYEAEDLRLSRRVAIKTMRDASQQDTLGERLFREARAAARAEHPAVITMYGYGTDHTLGVSYVVMERLDGEDLEQRCDRVGKLPCSLVTRIGVEAADALAAVHAAGVIHRDLKPSNIFLAKRGMRVDEVKLLDFGVAKLADMATLTFTGEIFGTPMYMSPEQLTDSKHVDARCDVYSLGAVLFQCLTGTPPYAAADVASLAVAVLLGPQPDVKALRPDAPEALLQIVSRCMRKKAKERYGSAQELRDALLAAS